MDWFCCPRFDSPSVVASLESVGGQPRAHPAAELARLAEDTGLFGPNGYLPDDSSRRS